MGDAVSAIDTVFGTSTKADIYDLLTASLGDIQTQVGAIQSSLSGLFNKKVTEADINAAIDSNAAATVKKQLTGGVLLVTSLQTVFDKMMSKTKSLISYVKVVS